MTDPDPKHELDCSGQSQIPSRPLSTTLELRVPCLCRSLTARPLLHHEVNRHTIHLVRPQVYKMKRPLHKIHWPWKVTQKDLGLVRTEWRPYNSMPQTVSHDEWPSRNKSLRP